MILSRTVSVYLRLKQMIPRIASVRYSDVITFIKLIEKDVEYASATSERSTSA